MATSMSSLLAPDATLTNGRYELPRSARGVLVLADPPEAGWQLRRRNDDQAAADDELRASPGRECAGKQTRDPCVHEDGVQV